MLTPSLDPSSLSASHLLPIGSLSACLLLPLRRTGTRGHAELEPAAPGRCAAPAPCWEERGQDV
eukprot:4407222-Pyramimonas_sp.AAC.1